MDDEFYARQSSLSVGLKRRCPRCGRGRLYKSFLTVADKCSACELDFSEVESGDGPAVLIIMIAGFIIVGLALYVEVSYQPAYWVHAVLWLPLSLVLPLILLPTFKAWMIAQQYQHKAPERRHDELGED